MATYLDISKDIQKKNLQQFYLLYGEESYFIDKLSQLFIEKIIPEEAKDFDQTIHYGDELNVEDLIADLMRFPLMSERVLIIIKEAQSAKNLEKLAPYLKEIPSQTTLVLCYKNKLDKRKTFFKLLLEKAVCFESQAVKEYKIAETIMLMAKEYGFEISNQVAQILADHTGTNLEQIASDLNKLALAINKPKHQISLDDIEQYIGISKEFNNFELIDAIVNKDEARAFKIVQHFAENEAKHPVQAILPLIFTFFSNLMICHYLPNKSKESIQQNLRANILQVNNYLAGLQNYSVMKNFQIIHQIRISDAKSKGVEATLSSTECLKDLLFFIFN